MKALGTLNISGKEGIIPLIEGGKGIAVSDGESSGAWAAANAVGTFSGVTPRCFDEEGNYIPENYQGKTRKERHIEMIERSIKGSVEQAQIAHEVSNGKGRIHINALWEMGGSEEILTGTLEKTKGLVHGVTCGAGMPYRLGEICSSYGVYYYPIVSSGRAFRALWKRAYKNYSEFLGGVVYEDPWRAGGHNGLSNSENPLDPQDPMPRVIELRKVMTSVGLSETPIVMAGGVWNLNDWNDWIDNPEIGPIAFQIGTRSLLVKESHIAEHWQKDLCALKKGDILLQTFSPTGFYSSAVRNDFINELEARSKRQINFAEEATDNLLTEIKTKSNKTVYISKEDAEKARQWSDKGFSLAFPTPDNTLVFLSEKEAEENKQSFKECVGCLSQCGFSAWSQHSENNSTGRVPDQRSFCIHSKLLNIALGQDTQRNLMFAGHNAHRYATDALYANNNIPTVQELVTAMLEGK